MISTPYTIEQCAIVILAAGKSSRLGSPKQLLPFKGKSLLRHAASAALQTVMRPVIVVVGANSDVIKKEMEGMKVELVENEEWPEGMASSIRCGLQALPDIAPAADGVIIMVCDQPFVSASLLGELITAQKDRVKKIVACKYTNTIGPPVFFHKSFFPELLELKGDEGAKKIIVQHMDDVATVLFPGGDIDIDTAAEYEALNQNQFT